MASCLQMYNDYRFLHILYSYPLPVHSKAKYMVSVVANIGIKHVKMMTFVLTP